MRPEPPRPTPSELEILGVLWELGPSSVREVQSALEERRPTGYTTVLKLLQIMTEKGIVERDESRRAHRYSPRLPREATEQQMVRDLVDRDPARFGRGAVRLVAQVAADEPALVDDAHHLHRPVGVRQPHPFLRWDDERVDVEQPHRLDVVPGLLVDLPDDALVLEALDAEALRDAFDRGLPVIVRADTADEVRAALTRPEVSCVLVRAERRELLELDLRSLTYG